MGVFFYTKSVALIEDVPLSEEYIGASAETDLRRDIDTGFQQVSFIMLGEICSSPLLRPLRSWIKAPVFK